MFVESAVAKWKLGSWEVVDKIPITYNIGHLATAEGDTVNPDGKYLVALNKLSHGRRLAVGPSQPESSQLINKHRFVEFASGTIPARSLNESR